MASSKSVFTTKSPRSGDALENDFLHCSYDLSEIIQDDRMVRKLHSLSLQSGKSTSAEGESTSSQLEEGGKDGMMKGIESSLLSLGKNTEAEKDIDENLTTRCLEGDMARRLHSPSLLLGERTQEFKASVTKSIACHIDGEIYGMTMEANPLPSSSDEISDVDKLSSPSASHVEGEKDKEKIKASLSPAPLRPGAALEKNFMDCSFNLDEIIQDDEMAREKMMDQSPVLPSNESVEKEQVKPSVTFRKKCADSLPPSKNCEPEWRDGSKPTSVDDIESSRGGENIRISEEQIPNRNIQEPPPESINHNTTTNTLPGAVSVPGISSRRRAESFDSDLEFVSTEATIAVTATAVDDIPVFQAEPVSDPPEEKCGDGLRDRLVQIMIVVFVLVITAIAVSLSIANSRRKAGIDPVASVPTMPSSSSPPPSTHPTVMITQPPSTSRHFAIRNIIKEVSSEEALHDKKSPQYSAFQWIANVDRIASENDREHIIQRYVLATLFFTTNSNLYWSNGYNFLTPKHECRWNGIDSKGNLQGVTFCDSLLRVTKILLDGNNLKGTIPREIMHLDQLTELSMNDNKITGKLPRWTMNELTSVSLNNNWLTGTIPFTIGLHAKLTEFKVENNGLTGTIPFQIGNLVGLHKLHLGDNALSGTIPSELGKLVRLHSLSLHTNEFVGNIPSSIAKLTNLTWLGLSYNHRLSGEIPPFMSLLTNLEQLYLQGNRFMGDANFLCEGIDFVNFFTDCLGGMVECGCCSYCCNSHGYCEYV